MKNGVIKNTGRLITIGYEGRQPKDFFATLICSGTSILCDVRKNAVSRKPGFSKKALSSACSQFSIEYRHLPEFGIDSSLRKKLFTNQDYSALFEIYKQTVLAETQPQQRELADELQAGKTIALLCFEKDPKMCHRSRLAGAIAHNAGKALQIFNL